MLKMQFLFNKNLDSMVAKHNDSCCVQQRYFLQSYLKAVLAYFHDIHTTFEWECHIAY